jgi:DNA-binding MarR family transcriptional regulator
MLMVPVSLTSKEGTVKMTERAVKPDEESAGGGQPSADYAAERMLRVLPQMFKQMMLQARDEVPSAFGEVGETQFRIIHALNHEEFTVGELAERMKVRAPTVSRMIDALVSRGWVARQADPADRRKVCLQLTEQGRGLAGAMETRFCSATARFLRPLSGEQLGGIVAACDSLEALLIAQRHAHSTRHETLLEEHN